MDTEPRVILIGASAGGVDALMRIVSGLTADLPAPVLVVLHIGAHRSQLPELLSARGPNGAAFAMNGELPKRGMIYVAPSDQHLLLDGGVMRLFHGPKEHHARPAIDPLFRSGAIDCGPRAVGVVLTGMLDDGAAGLRAIKACGGTAVVQDPTDASEPSMPLSALASVTADHVVGVNAMAQLLNRLALPIKRTDPAQAPEWLRTEHAVSIGLAGMGALATIGSPSGFTCPDCGGALFEIQDASPLRFLCHTGHAFSLRSLAWMQEELSDEALWRGLRALQEKEAILRRLSQSVGPAAGDALAELHQLQEFVERLKLLVSTAPSGTSGVDGPYEAPT